jgi:hypothetical protein
MEKFLHGHMAALKAGIENGTVVLYKDSVDGPVLDKNTPVKVGDDVEFKSKC